ncbi:MAG TPA: PqqD family protein [Thermoleophilaceae bacterium]|nr:PqqD family protein [Thermoleophilaceae bacterium]
MSERILRLRPEAVHFREVEGHIVAVDVAGGEYFAVNPSGAALWPALAEGTTLEDLGERLVARFHIAKEQARADAAAFVAVLDERGLLA